MIVGVDSGMLHRWIHMPGGDRLAASRFCAFVEQIRRERRPTDLVVAVDSHPTWRHEVFPGYKAGRERTPDEQAIVDEQMGLMHRALLWDVVEVPGMEADDVLASVATCGPSILVTHDKDLCQCVTGDCTLWDGKQETGPAEVETRFGVRPDQMVDYQAIVGDSVDSIPGIFGLGDVAARALLIAHDTLDGVLTAAHDEKTTMKPRWRKLLLAGEQQARVSRVLATLRTDLNVGIRRKSA